MNLRPALRILGRLLNVLAVAECLPLGVCWWYGETRGLVAFAVTAAVTGLCGFLLTRAGRGSRELYRREGILIVVGGWLLASLFGALPYLG